MTGADRAIRWSTIAAVAAVGWLSLCSATGISTSWRPVTAKSALTATLLPVSTPCCASST
jgi:hypothetical protein